MPEGEKCRKRHASQGDEDMASSPTVAVTRHVKKMFSLQAKVAPQPRQGQACVVRDLVVSQVTPRRRYSRGAAGTPEGPAKDSE